MENGDAEPANVQINGDSGRATARQPRLRQVLSAITSATGRTATSFDSTCRLGRYTRALYDVDVKDLSWSSVSRLAYC